MLLNWWNVSPISLFIDGKLLRSSENCANMIPWQPRVWEMRLPTCSCQNDWCHLRIYNRCEFNHHSMITLNGDAFILDGYVFEAIGHELLGLNWHWSHYEPCWLHGIRVNCWINWCTFDQLCKLLKYFTLWLPFPIELEVELNLICSIIVTQRYLSRKNIPRVCISYQWWCLISICFHMKDRSTPLGGEKALSTKLYKYFKNLYKFIQNIQKKYPHGVYFSLVKKPLKLWKFFFRKVKNSILPSAFS